MKKKTDLLQGTLHLLILQALAATRGIRVELASPLLP